MKPVESCFFYGPLIAVLAMCLPCQAEDQTPARKPAETVVWYDVSTLPLEGQGWTDTASRYDRLPARAEAMVRPAVWSLAQNSAGLSVRFITDATKIRARWTLRSDRIAMSHMAATGVSGVDLYVRSEGKWHFLAVGRPAQFPVNDVLLTQGLVPGEKEFRLSFPLYNGVEKVEIGIPPSATFRAPDPLPKQKPIVFYGTSITQGGCASRPGMSYPAILGRRMEMPVINLGFSGNGKSEPEMATLLAELDPALYVIDCLPNLETAQAVERLPGFIATLRAAHPQTPILLVENFIYTNSPFVAERDAKQRTSTEFLQEFHARLKADGDQHLFIVSAENLIGTDGEATVDALHPTDAGFLRMADVLEPAIRQALTH
ncbi:SGNH/GDSL hydrolase family protein [Planctomicrobium piriforme]|uniref:Lysophospholipase L1 n=1 Tax=Planctomicrobium piriforme TaxID=1576369 RepID=A0A1I3H200_9PLAN|nr:SGNH/GDSL hydrolase family protein [Planctomicrobium piriforme]SFI29590.1 Lysophospholipase L1 [Planctomicrobium piriforme]